MVRIHRMRTAEPRSTVASRESLFCREQVFKGSRESLPIVFAGLCRHARELLTLRLKKFFPFLFIVHTIEFLPKPQTAASQASRNCGYEAIILNEPLVADLDRIGLQR